MFSLQAEEVVQLVLFQLRANDAQPAGVVGSADYTGRLCVIGAQLKEHELHHLFGL